jgi:ABC-type multidrug transport system ATPase subunit
MFINNVHANVTNIRQTSSYVEQQDHLIGSNTTAKTLSFAAKLGLSEWVYTIMTPFKAFN